MRIGFLIILSFFALLPSSLASETVLGINSDVIDAKVAAPAPPVEISRNYSVRLHLIAQEEAVLSSQFSGKVTKVFVQNGSFFRKGQTLVSFDCSILLAHQAKAEAEYETALLNHQSNKDLDQFEAISNLEVELTRVDLKRAAAELKIITTQLQYCSIKAPYDGIVTKMHLHPHESVENGVEMLEIVQHGTPKIFLLASSRTLMHLRPKLRFTVKVLETGKEYPAQIIRIGGKIDPVSQTIQVYGEFIKKHPKLLPGMSGQASFNFQQK